MKYIDIFGRITKANIKDCFFINDMLTFIVQENEIGKAIGKRGVSVKMVEKALNRKIKIVEFSPNLEVFLRNLVYPIPIKDITKEEGVVVISGNDKSSNSIIIGRNASNLNNIKDIIKRYFDIKDIKVI